MGLVSRYDVAWQVVVALAVTGCSPGAGRVVPADLADRPASPTVVTEIDTTTVTTAPIETVTATAPAVPLVSSSASTPEPPTAGGSAGTDDVTARLDPDLGDPVSDAPGVGTRGDTRRLLDEGLWVHLAWEPDPADPAVYAALPDDVAVLEAYTRAQLAYYRAALGLSDSDDPTLDEYLVDGVTRFADAFATRRAAGVRLWLGTGVVLRPYVLGDRRTATSAMVLDCYLHDEQELPIGTDPSAGPLRRYGLVVTMVVVDGRWKVDRIGSEAEVCA